MIREMKKISTVMKNNDESYELASEDESVESEDASSSNEDNIAQNSAVTRKLPMKEIVGIV